MGEATNGTETGVSWERKVEELFREHYTFMFSAAKKKLRGQRDAAKDAEDVVQNLFLKFIQSPLPPEALKDPKGYLHRATVNASLDLIRSRNSRKETDGVEKLQMPSTRTGRANENVAKKLQDLLGTLQDHVQEIVLLHNEHGYSDADIAEMTGQSRSKIASILSRARAKFNKVKEKQKEKYVQA